jgi:hypothetical protein
MDTRCFDYVYDFGDDWHHLVLVEDVYPKHPTAIADPRHEEHQNYLTWVGGRFDPTRFDRAAVNRALAKIKL